jgi:RND family efflux transporter MFP subunit
MGKLKAECNMDRLRLPVAVASLLLFGGSPAWGEAPSPVGIEPDQLDCMIQPDMTVDLGSSLPGIIDTVDVDRGDIVTQGQIVAKLNSSVQRARVELAKAQAGFNGDVQAKQAALDFAERKQQRMGQLYERHMISLDGKDEAESAKLQAQQDFRAAEERRLLAKYEVTVAEQELELRNVRSPMSGIITERLLSPGTYVEDKPILRIAKIDPLRVEVVVPVTRFGTITKGMNAKVTPELAVSGGYVATVNRVDRVIDAASGTFGVRLELPNRDMKIPSGLKCRVSFDNLASKSLQIGSTTTPTPTVTVAPVAAVAVMPSVTAVPVATVATTPAAVVPAAAVPVATVVAEAVATVATEPALGEVNPDTALASTDASTAPVAESHHRKARRHHRGRRRHRARHG